MTQLLKRLRKSEEGFTLIELMVVVLIIAILIAIAIPTFLGARTRAQNRAAQSDLRNGLTSEKTVYTDSQLYSATVATMKGIEPSLNWETTTPAATDPANSVEVTVSTSGQELCLAARSASGTTFYLVDVATAGGSLTAGTFYGDSNNSGAAPTCDGSTALPSSFNASSTTGWA